MKRILLLFVLLLSISPIKSQEHLKFRGVPIDGNVNSFIDKLRDLGYYLYDSSDSDEIIMKGKFLNKDCDIIIVTTPKYRTVAKVVVSTQEYYSWSSIKKDYIEVKHQYCIKYGDPKSYEFFSKPYTEGDGDEMSALKLDKCTFMSVYYTMIGKICVKMTLSSNIWIEYEDNYNMEKMDKEIQDEI
jgi:hypothetical protein